MNGRLKESIQKGPARVTYKTESCLRRKPDGPCPAVASARQLASQARFREVYGQAKFGLRANMFLMTKSRMNPKAEFFFAKAKTWRKEFEQLRKIILDCGLNEELKWGKPCYSFQKGNIVLIHGFKEYCALLFFKGALLKDASGILIQQTENVQAARQIRFANVQEIAKMAPVLKAYIKEAVEVEKAGLQVNYKKTSQFVIPEEFQNKLDESPALKTAFDALTPGRQRGYLLYFSAAKQPKTRESRVEKCMPQILYGKGLDDR